MLLFSFDDDDDDDDESDSPRPLCTADLVRLPATPPTATAAADDAADVVVVVVVATKRGAKARTPPTSRSMMMVPKGEEKGCFRFDPVGADGILGVEYLCIYGCRCGGSMVLYSYVIIIKRVAGGLKRAMRREWLDGKQGGTCK